MRNWRLVYIRFFLLIIGFVFALTGIVSSFFDQGELSFANLFKIVGALIILASLYLWYRDYQKR